MYAHVASENISTLLSLPNCKIFSVELNTSIEKTYIEMMKKIHRNIVTITTNT